MTENRNRCLIFHPCQGIMKTGEKKIPLSGDKTQLKNQAVAIFSQSLHELGNIDFLRIIEVGHLR